MDTTTLEEIGFTKGETKVYFALLELGESSIGNISKKANVTPSKTYIVLEKLIRKGLITKIIKSNTTYFQAFHPDRILSFLNEKKNKIISEKKRSKK